MEISCSEIEQMELSTVKWKTEDIDTLVTRGIIDCHLVKGDVVERKELCSSFNFLDKIWEIRTIHMDQGTFGLRFASFERYVLQVKMLSKFDDCGILTAKIRPCWKNSVTTYDGEDEYRFEFSRDEYCLHYSFNTDDFEFIQKHNTWTLEIEIEVYKPHGDYIFYSDVYSVQKFLEVKRSQSRIDETEFPCTDCTFPGGLHDVSSRIYPKKRIRQRNPGVFFMHPSFINDRNNAKEHVIKKAEQRSERVCFITIFLIFLLSMMMIVLITSGYHLCRKHIQDF